MPRYIDAEKLLNELQKRYESALSWYENVRDPDLKIRAEQAVASFLESILTIKNQPTANVQEVKYGEWLENGANYKCSVCGNTESYYSDSYCRICGAKMDGKENNK